ncbi:hypothetical protein STEG23_005058, partial [Scotinomys teguina]
CKTPSDTMNPSPHRGHFQVNSGSFFQVLCLQHWGLIFKFWEELGCAVVAHTFNPNTCEAEIHLDLYMPKRYGTMDLTLAKTSSLKSKKSNDKSNVTEIVQFIQKEYLTSKPKEGLFITLPGGDTFNLHPGQQEQMQGMEPISKYRHGDDCSHTYFAQDVYMTTQASACHDSSRKYLEPRTMLDMRGNEQNDRIDCGPHSGEKKTTEEQPIPDIFIRSQGLQPLRQQTRLDFTKDFTSSINITEAGSIPVASVCQKVHPRVECSFQNYSYPDELSVD